MSTQLPIMMEVSPIIPSYTPLGLYYKEQGIKAKSRVTIRVLLEYLAKNGPQSKKEIWNALELKTRYIEDGKNGLRKEKQGAYVWYETLIRHINGLLDYRILVRDRNKIDINRGSITIIKRPYPEDPYKHNFKSYQRNIRRYLGDMDLVKGIGTTFLFYHKRDRTTIEENQKVLFALALIDEGNKLLNQTIYESIGEAVFPHQNYLVASYPHDELVAALNILSGYGDHNQTTEFMEPITKGLIEYEDKFLKKLAKDEETEK